MAGHHHTDLLVALVGQPNCGKSTIFSRLTGIHQRTANYVGVTVEKKSGHFHDGALRVEIVDLPGTYSLTSLTQEEKVTRDFILLEQPEVVVVVLDAANLQRHLYLALQILEMQIPAILCLNMVDVARRRGHQIDIGKLSEQLSGTSSGKLGNHIQIVATNGQTGDGVEELRHAILQESQQTDHVPTTWRLNYGDTLEPSLNSLTTEVEKRPHLIEDFPARWLAVKLLENNRDAKRIVQHHTHDDSWESLLNVAETARNQFTEQTGTSPQQKVAETLYDTAKSITEQCVSQSVAPKQRRTDIIDRYVCHPIGGLVFAAAVLFLGFQFIFQLADGWQWIPNGYGGYSVNTVHGMDGGNDTTHGDTIIWRSPVETCAFFFETWLPQTIDSMFGLSQHTGPFGTIFRSLILDGIVAGIGGILQFLPLIFLVFLLIAVLEQSGFIARISVVMDRFVRYFGLCGESVLPFILGGGLLGGCAVPAIMAARTIRGRRERLLTIIVTPMMNCGAKIPLFAVLIAAFFSDHRAAVMAILIFLSWAGALFSAWILGKTAIHGSALPLLVELPSYLFPSVKAVFTHAISQCWQFVQKVGTTILAINIVVWAMMYFPIQFSENEVSANIHTTSSRLEHSIAGRLGKMLVPVSQFAGFGWQENVALIGGVAAKEVIVSSLGTIHGIEEEEIPNNVQNQTLETATTLSQRLSASPQWNSAKAMAMLVFVMFYAPCVATCVTMRRETQSWWWVVLSFGYSTLFAYILAVVVFQLGHL